MECPHFNPFRLVGGTALSLQRGHRISVDIDLFTDESYGSIEFNQLFLFFQNKWPYFDTLQNVQVGMGKSAFIGYDKANCVKVDIYYTDHFISNYHIIEGIRLATVEEIIAMKMEVISDKGRKKDFWDIHELIEDYSFTEMLDLHKKRYLYTHDRKTLINNFTNFKYADNDLEPNCLRSKIWELIKIDLIDFSGNKL